MKQIALTVGGKSCEHDISVDNGVSDCVHSLKKPRAFRILRRQTEQMVAHRGGTTLPRQHLF